MSLTDQEMEELSRLEGQAEFTDADVDRVNALYAQADAPDAPDAPDAGVLAPPDAGVPAPAPALAPPDGGLAPPDGGLAPPAPAPAELPAPPPPPTASRLDSVVITREGLKVRFQAPWMEKQTEWNIQKPGLVETGFGNASNFVNEVLTPAVIDPLQKAARFGTPVTPAAEDDAVKIRQTFGPAAEYLYRAGMQTFAGRGFLEEMDERERREAINDMEALASHPLLRKFLPTLGALPGVGLPALTVQAGDVLAPGATSEALSAAPAALAESVGQAPLMFVGVGEGGAIATRAASYLPKLTKLGQRVVQVGESMVQGAVGNVMASTAQGAKRPVGLTEIDAAGKPVDKVDLALDALVGGLFGVSFHALARVPKVIAFTRAAMEDFAKVLFGAGERGEELLKGFVRRDALEAAYREAANVTTQRDPALKAAAGAEAARASAAGELPQTQVTRGPKGRPQVDIDPTAIVVGQDDSGTLVAHLWEITGHQERRLARIPLDNKRVAQWVGARARASGVAPIVTFDASRMLEERGLARHLFKSTSQAVGPGGTLETVVDRATFAKMMRGDAPSAEAMSQPGPAKFIHVHEDGSWTANRLATREERAAAMRVHKLASVVDENGQRRFGYLMESGGETWLSPPHPEEEISGALVAGMRVKPGEAKLVPQEELLTLAEHVPASVAMFQPRHDPRVVSPEALLTQTTKFLHTAGILRRKAALQRALKMPKKKRPEEFSREMHDAIRRLADGMGVKKPEAEVLLRLAVGASKPSEASAREVKAIADSLLARGATDDGDVPLHIRQSRKLQAMRSGDDPTADVVGPENYPGPENIPESSVRIRKPQMMPKVLKGMGLTGEAQKMGAPSPPADLIGRELAATKALHEAKQRAGSPETPEQTAARLERVKLEGAFGEWHRNPNAPPPVVRLRDGAVAEVVAHEAEGTLWVRDATGVRRASVDDLVAFVGDAPQRKRMFTTVDEVRQALATAYDAGLSAERKAVVRGDILASARKDGFSDALLAKALTDAETKPRSEGGLLYGASPEAPGRPAPVGGGGAGSGLPPSDLPPIPSSPSDPPRKSPPPELLPPQDAAMAGFLARAGKTLANPVHWANRDIATAAMKVQSERSLQQVLTVNWEKRWKKLMGKVNDTPQFRADVVRAARGEMSLDELAAQYPFIAGLRRQFLETAFRKRAENDQRIRELGMLPEKSDVGVEAVEEYLTREFFRFQWAPGEWAKFIKEYDRPRIAAAIAHFEKRIPDAEVIGAEGLPLVEVKKLKKAQAARYVDAIIGDEAFANFNIRNADPSALPPAMRSLRERKLDATLKDLEAQAAQHKGDVPAELEKALKAEREHVAVMKGLLGESTDGMRAVGTTLARQETLIHRGEMLRDLSNVPELVSPYAGQRTGDGRWFVQVPNDRAGWGQLSGKYIHPDLHEALTWTVGTEEIAKGWMSLPWRLFKANILLPGVGGFSPMAHNMTGDLVGGIVSGGLDITSNPARVMRAIKKAAVATRAAADPLRLVSPEADLYTRAVSWGAILPGYAELELSPRMTKALASLERDPRATVWDHIATVMNPVMWGRKAVAALGKVYDAPSRFFKFAAWIGNRERILANPKKYLGPRYAPGMSRALLEHHVEALATKWINDSFPCFDRIGRWQEAIRASGPAGAAVPTFATEDIRIHAMLPGRLIRSGRAAVTGDVSSGADPDLVWRVLRWGLVTTAMGGMFAAKRRANGISDEDVKQAIEATPDYVQGHGLGLFADMERDENGKVVIRDYSAFIAPLRYTYGRDDAPWPTRIAWNLVKTPIAGGPYDSPMVRIFGDPLGIEDTMGGGEAKAWQKNGAGYIDLLLKTPLAPQGIQRAFGPAYRAGAFGDPSTFTNRLSTKQAMAHYFGLPTYPIGPGEIGRDAYLDMLQVKAAAKEVRSAARQERGGPAMQAREALGGPSVRQQAIDSAQEEYRRTLNRKFPQEKKP